MTQLFNISPCVYCLVIDSKKCWKSTDLASAIRVDDEFKLKLKRPESES